MALSTPEDLARDIASQDHALWAFGATDLDGVENLIARAVKADRQQIIADMTEVCHVDILGAHVVRVGAYIRRLRGEV